MQLIEFDGTNNTQVFSKTHDPPLYDLSPVTVTYVDR